MAYATIKLIQLYEGSNPVISELYEQNYFSKNAQLNLNKINWRVAFTVEGQFDQERKDDPRFTKFLVRRKVSNPQESYEEDRFLSYHRCTDHDYAQFYPVSPDSKALFDEIRTDEKRGFYCIDDWEIENLELGLTKYNHISLIDIIVAPCNYKDKL